MPSRERRKVRERAAGRRRFLAIAGVAVLVVASGAIALVVVIRGGATTPKKPAPGLHFEVNAVNCGSQNINTAQGTLKAPAEFCIADLSVKTMGVSTAAMDLTCQYLVTQSGTRLSSDKQGTALLNGSQAATGKLDVGTAPESVSIAFDAPHGTHVKALELHSSCTSPGVTITRSG
jgi:hypothetical protein